MLRGLTEVETRRVFSIMDKDIKANNIRLGVRTTRQYILDRLPVAVRILKFYADAEKEKAAQQSD